DVFSHGRQFNIFLNFLSTIKIGFFYSRVRAGFFGVQWGAGCGWVGVCYGIIAGNVCGRD
ncbi:MAG: hypothetical protein OSB74_08585, partial [Verrucomicrobiota bacterium]|nr:hypothetical protein [Verrucomicrobiota bacterium]